MRPGMSRLARALAAAMRGALNRAATLPPSGCESLAAPQPKVTVAELLLVESVAGALRDRLNTIMGFSELLAHGEGLVCGGEGADTARRFILESSEELNRFLADLQDFVRHEQGRLHLAEQQVDAAELAEAALSACRGAAESADVTIVARLDEGFELRCDPVRIRTAIADMVLWTAGLAPAGSVIGLRLSRLQPAGVTLSVTGIADPQRIDTENDVFEPCQAAGGLKGLSLPMARRVALLHSGDMTVERGPGGKTTLRLVLPPHRVIGPQRIEVCKNRAA
jgi:signal transduction histidine kinase